MHRQACNVPVAQSSRARGLTLIELLLAMTVSIVILSAIGVAMIGGIRGYDRIYGRASSGVLGDGYVTARAFKAAIRKSSANSLKIDQNGVSLTAQYHSSLSSTGLDRYVRFYLSKNELRMEHGNVSPSQRLRTQTLCSDVSSCTFSRAGNTVQMVLETDDGAEKSTLLASAIPQN